MYYMPPSEDWGAVLVRTAPRALQLLRHGMQQPELRAASAGAEIATVPMSMTNAVMPAVMNFFTVFLLSLL